MQIAIIKTISYLRDNISKIADICHHDGEPAFITKNGQGDMVVMSIAMYENQHISLNFNKSYLLQKNIANTQLNESLIKNTFTTYSEN